MSHALKHTILSVDEALKTGECAICGVAPVGRRSPQRGWRCRNAVRAAYRARYPNKAPRHRITEVDASTQRGHCSLCGPVGLHRGLPGQWRCSVRVQRWVKANYHANAPVVRERERRTGIAREREWKASGILSPRTRTFLKWPEFLEKWLDQEECCAVCQSDENGTRFAWSADHDHQTGLFRGVLCHVCNVGIGYYEKSGARPGSGKSVLFQNYLDSYKTAISPISP